MRQNLDISTLFLERFEKVESGSAYNEQIRAPVYFRKYFYSFGQRTEQRLRNNLQCCIPLPGSGTAASKVNTILITA
jgi:hypothetical protein